MTDTGVREAAAAASEQATPALAVDLGDLGDGRGPANRVFGWWNAATGHPMVMLTGFDGVTADDFAAAVHVTINAVMEEAEAHPQEVARAQLASVEGLD